MVEKGEIMTCTYRTIGEIPPFSTISHYPYIWSSAVTYGHGPVPYTQLTRPLSAGGNTHRVCYSNFVRWRCCLNYGFCFYLGMKVGGLAPDLTERGPGKIFPHRPGWGRNNDFPTIRIDLKAALVF